MVPMFTCAAVQPSITIDASTKGPAVQPSMYGLFYEEINHSGDGGLYGELIQNRNFEEIAPVEGCTVDEQSFNHAPHAEVYNRPGLYKDWKEERKFETDWPAWSLETSGGATAALAIDQSRSLNKATPRSLKISITQPGDVRVINEGYWGIGVRKGEKYDLSFFARAAKKTDPKARFVLVPQGAGTVWLDVVSLFPRKTFKDRKNGMRADVAQLLADMDPAFLRFPGGCIVEGATLENRVKWKETIGPIDQRPGHWILWHYRATDGLGYHEYLQMCEDFGADAMYVFNIGMACEFRNGDFVPDDQIEPFIQSALDAIEYAIGPVDSKWGAKRAANGHPKPFPLVYVQIGNEQHGDRYNRRHKIFYERIKAVYPYLKFVTCTSIWEGANRWDYPKEVMGPVEILDEHFYRNPAWFFSNTRRYDAYPRDGGPEIYVGEYACNREVRGGQMIAALSEAAFMTGMERNSDVVTMTSFAPLLFNVNDQRWPVNMIGFDTDVSFGRSSYHVQKLFSVNRPDYNLPTTVSAEPVTIPPRHGLAGFATWETKAEFEFIRVEDGENKFDFDFSKRRPGNWPRYGGEWRVIDGTLRQTTMKKACMIIPRVGPLSFGDCTVTARARKISGKEGFMVLFRARDNKNFHQWNIGGWGNKFHAIQCSGSGGKTIGKRAPGSIETGRWYDIKIEVKGNHIRCYLDGELIHDEIDRINENSERFFAVSGRDEKAGETVIKVVNGSGKPHKTVLRINGAKKIKPRGRVITLSSQNPTDENSAENPKLIIPVESVFDGFGSEFEYTFKPWSFTILRVKTE